MSVHRYAAAPGRRGCRAVARRQHAAIRPPTDPASRARAVRRLKIALSNSFIGNQWRVEMENVFKAACAMPPYLEQVECSIYNAGNDVSTQSRQISNLISQGVERDRHQRRVDQRPQRRGPAGL